MFSSANGKREGTSSKSRNKQYRGNVQTIRDNLSITSDVLMQAANTIDRDLTHAENAFLDEALSASNTLNHDLNRMGLESPCNDEQARQSEFPTLTATATPSMTA